MMAAARADPKMVEMLIAHGADVNITDSKGKTAIDIAHQSKDEATIDAVQSGRPSPPT